MFRKTLTVKNSRSLRSSERKKLLLRLTEPVSAVLSQKQTISLLQALTAKGERFKIYLCDGSPMLFEFDRGNEETTLFPTVFLAWLIPQSYPNVCVPSALLDTLQGGADLMVPGIMLDYQLPSFERGSPVMVSVVSRVEGPNGDSIATVAGPLFVGRALMAQEGILNSGGRGRAVQILHSVQDSIWELGEKSTLVPQRIATPHVPDLPMAPHSSRNEMLNESEKPLGNAILSDQAATASRLNCDANPTDNESQKDTDMDLLLRDTFFSALRWRVKNKSGIAFPIDVGQFYANYVLKCLPDGVRLDLKKTRTKKFSTFLKNINEELGDRQWVVRIANRKGVEAIEEINFDHPNVLGAKPLVGDAADLPASQTVNVIDCYSVTEPALRFLSHCNSEIRKGDLLRAEEVRNLVKAYATKQNLCVGSDNNKGRMVLDDALQILLQCFLSNTSVDINAVVQKVTAQMTPAFKVVLSAASGGGQRVYKNKLPVVEFKVERRGGNKLVTLINNLEVFGVDAKEFCSREVHATGSTIITDVPNCIGPQVLLQGNQVTPVAKTLQGTYGLQKKHMSGLELGVNEERKKKKK